MFRACLSSTEMCCNIRLSDGDKTLRQQCPRIILAADIGGTYSRFGIFEYDGDSLCDRGSCWLATWENNEFSHLVGKLRMNKLDQWLPRVTDVVVAVPGPVRNGKAPNLPNVPWNLDVSGLHGCFPGVPRSHLHLINDFVAQVLACGLPVVADAICVQRGDRHPTGVVSVIGAGTGLGCCSLICGDSQRPTIVPSEAGHMDFVFQSSDDRRFKMFLQEETGSECIDCNLVVSGRGLTLLHEFITGNALSPQEVAQQLTPESKVCRQFATYYGRVARNYALCVLPTGGLYAAGGVAARTPCLVDHDSFRNEFMASEAHAELLRSIPIYLVVNEESGIWGAARYAVMSSTQAEIPSARELL